MEIAFREVLIFATNLLQPLQKYDVLLDNYVNSRVYHKNEAGERCVTTTLLQEITSHTTISTETVNKTFDLMGHNLNTHTHTQTHTCFTCS